jgi:hypothetical protein
MVNRLHMCPRTLPNLRIYAHILPRQKPCHPQSRPS